MSSRQLRAMPGHAANLNILFGELGFLDRFEAAAQAGFEGVEFLFPYSYPVEQIAHRLCSHGLQLVRYCLPAGDWGGGERGIACHPSRTGEFRYGVEEAIRYARPLGVRQLRCLAGLQPADVTPELARLTLVDNLRYAAGLLKPHGIALQIALRDALGVANEPGYFITGGGQALDIIRDTGSDNLFLPDQGDHP
ncbi:MULTISPECIES: TIM barrel protein [Duganella]|uniref:TIM barrel protein n=1 Tax=Duganella TaxID=75654 RepID=UPI0033421F8F